MVETSRVILLIPTYNEAENIGLILKRIFQVDPRLHVLVIDDSSPDGTARVVEAKQREFPHLELLQRRQNPGFAQSYLDGFTRVKHDKNFDVVVTMDADFSHDPQEIPAMLDVIHGGAEAVIGSRYAKVRNFRHIPLWRRVLSRFANEYVRLILHLPVSDCTSGFIAMRREVLEKLPLTGIRTEGYGILFELKYRLHQAGFEVAEHAVDWPDRHLGASKMNFRRIFESVRLPWRIRFRPAAPAYRSSETQAKVR